MTAQEIFDLIVNHLRQQNSKSTRIVKYWNREQVDCVIRGDDDKKDAVGILIEDTEYSETMEGWTFGSLLQYKDTPKSLKDKYLAHAFLIDALNFVHDFYDPSIWENEFAAIASSFKLKYKKLAT